MVNYKVTGMPLFRVFIFFLGVKFASFSVNTSKTSAPKLNLAVLPVETSSGTGYPPIKHSLLIGDLLWMAREGGAIEAFSVSSQALTENVVFPFAEDRNFVALFELEDSTIGAVSDHGELATWTLQDLTVTLKHLPNVSQVQAAAKKGNVLAVGGKGPKNNLKVFDLTTLTCSFAAKPSTDTRLNRPFTIDIRAICFTSSEKFDSFAVANSDGQIFLYDFSLSSLPQHFRQVLPKKTALMSLARAEKDGSVVFTDTTGVIECYDLIKGKSYGRFKPQEGSVQIFLLSGADSILLTASKDRFLRIFNYSTRALLHKIYLKHVPTTLAITRQDWLAVHAQQYEDSDDEEVWEGMAPAASEDKKRIKLDR